MIYLFLFFVGLWAGTQNALAGGGSFLTLPALLFSGLDAISANITSTLALYPGQLSTAYTGLSLAKDAPSFPLRTLIGLSLVGGILGALLLLITPVHVFERLLPWLILSATLLFAWGSFRQKPFVSQHIPHQEISIFPPLWAQIFSPVGLCQLAIGIYGGYFGGGIGFLMMAALTFAGLSVKPAGAVKNILAAAMNSSAAFVFLFSSHIVWSHALSLGTGAVGGGLLGGWLLHRVSDVYLRFAVICLGSVLTFWLFLKGF